MKKIIAKLRLAGVVTFIGFFILSFTGSSNFAEFKFTQAEMVLVCTSFTIFVIIIALQLYRLYIKDYYAEDDDNNTE